MPFVVLEDLLAEFVLTADLVCLGCWVEAPSGGCWGSLVCGGCWGVAAGVVGRGCWGAAVVAPREVWEGLGGVMGNVGLGIGARQE